jgi:hypothetical protein
MFISSGSTQSSLWGFSSRILDTTGLPAAASNTGGAFAPMTLAPNGFLYAIPNKGIPTTTQVLKVDPKTSNYKEGDYQKSTGSLLTSPTSTAFSSGSGYTSKGILAPNGKIYFIPIQCTTLADVKVCIFDPGDSTGNNVSWDFFTIPSQYLNSVVGYGQFAGGILGKDGKIYLIPWGSPALIRLDVMSGSTPIVESSYYGSGAAIGSSYVLGNCSSSGDIITFSASPGAASSIPTTVVGYKVSPWYVGSDIQMTPPSLPSGYPGPPFMYPPTGRLDSQEDTYVTERISATSFRVSPAPAIPFNIDGLVLHPFASNLSSILTTNRLWSYNNKFLASRNESGLLVQNTYPRFAVANVIGNSQAVIQQRFSGGALDPTPGSNKIFLLPGPGTQIFYIDPDNWSNHRALSTKGGLSIASFGFNTVSPTTYGFANAWDKFSNIVPGIDNNLYIYMFTTFSNPVQNRIYKIDTQTLVVSQIVSDAKPPLTPLDYQTPTNLKDVGVLPNGFAISRGTFSAIPVYTRLDGSNPITYINVDIPYTTSSLTDGKISGNNALVYTATGNFSTISSDENKRGKVVITGRNIYYGAELVSVKGFYDGVTNFDLIDSNYLDIPDNLADLPTSKYNVFSNRYK